MRLAKRVTTSPDLRLAVVTIAFGLFAVFSMKFITPSTPELSASIGFRIVFLLAAVLMMQNAIIGATIAASGARRWRSAAFWMHAFYNGYFFAVLMVLLLWSGPADAPIRFLTGALGGAVFGIWTTVLNHDARAPWFETLVQRYDLERPVTEKPMGGLYHWWPLIIVALLASLVLFPPKQGWDDRYLLFQPILLGSVMPLYQPRRPLDNWPSFLGIGLLIMGLFLL